MLSYEEKARLQRKVVKKEAQDWIGSTAKVERPGKSWSST
jgi:hypothetical protein